MTPLFLSARLDETGEDQGCIEILASVQAPQLDAAQAEIQAIVHWAQAHAPGPKGPLEEGGSWDADLGTQQEGGWNNLSLSLVGPLAWCEALLQHFSLDD